MKKFCSVVAILSLQILVACGDELSMGSDGYMDRSEKYKKEIQVFTSLNDAKKVRCSLLSECEIIVYKDEASKTSDSLQCVGGQWLNKSNVDLTEKCLDRTLSEKDTILDWYSCEMIIDGVFGTHTCDEVPDAEADSLKRYCKGMSGYTGISGISGTQCPGGYIASGKSDDRILYTYSYSTKSSSSRKESCLNTFNDGEIRCYSGSNASLLCGATSSGLKSSEFVSSCPEDPTATCPDYVGDCVTYFYKEGADCHSF